MNGGLGLYLGCHGIAMPAESQTEPSDLLLTLAGLLLGRLRRLADPAARALPPAP